MQVDEDRLSKVEARCSGQALQLARTLRSHSTFPQLLDSLERMHGTIFRGDVEQAFRDLSKPPEEKSDRNPSG